MKPTQNPFCMKQFKPVIAVIVLLSAGVVGWTILRQNTAEPSVFCNRGAVMQAAAAPPIKAGVAAPHPNWGSCSNCHEIIDAGVATKVAAVARGTVAVTPLGFWIGPISPTTAEKLGLEKPEGVIVTGVRDPSPASDAGLRVGDVILRMENTQVAGVNDVASALAQKDPQDRVNVQIFRNGKPRRLFIDPAANPNNQETAQASPVALAQPAQTLVAVAATSGDLNAQVAPVFSSAPTFIIYDQVTGVYSTLQNRGAGSLTAGQQASAQLAGAGVGAVIVGNIGPASAQRLMSSGIRVYSGTFGPVRQVLNQYGQGKLVAASGSSVRPTLSQAPGAQSALNRRVAVASDGPTLDSTVAADLGAAPYLIIYDLGTGKAEALAKDPDLGQGTGAMETAQLIVEQGASAVIAGSISQVSVKTLSALGIISFSGVVGNVGQAAQLYETGQLQATPVASGVRNAQTVVPVASSGLTL